MQEFFPPVVVTTATCSSSSSGRRSLPYLSRGERWAEAELRPLWHGFNPAVTSWIGELWSESQETPGSRGSRRECLPLIRRLWAGAAGPTRSERSDVSALTDGCVPPRRSETTHGSAGNIEVRRRESIPAEWQEKKQPQQAFAFPPELLRGASALSQPRPRATLKIPPAGPPPSQCRGQGSSAVPLSQHRAQTTAAAAQLNCCSSPPLPPPPLANRV